MKKRAVKVLLPLLFSFCCVFSGFLSVDAYAYASEYHLYPMYRQNMFCSSSDISQIEAGLYPATSMFNGRYQFKLSGGANIYYQWLFGDAQENFTYPYEPDLYDYYVLGSFAVNYKDASVVNDFNLGSIRYYDYNNGVPVLHYPNVSINRTYNYNSHIYNFYFPLDAYSDLTVFLFDFSPDVSFIDRTNASFVFEASVLAVEKDASSEYVQGIISAINNQTNVLDDSIGQAADDIQQSIEDQYSGEPEDEFAVDDVITQHNEKMGVLSFGSDVMLQFLDMFQSANVGTAELTLPGFNITVENVEYSVWPDYSFNFEQLNEWVPALMSVIRVMLPVFVWLMVLRYCIKVFEDNFLSK